ncbi:MAG TPA: hypothetical protein PKW59_13705 [Thermotogota bacterium]|mgnify:CR=1 FL=1|nr:hypothetical protein [Thermotogota bacterium]
MEEAGIESGIKALLEAILKGSSAEAEGITKDELYQIFFGEDEEG